MTTVDEILEMHARLESGEARRLRKAAGLSMNAVARELQVTPSTVLHWEQNERQPRGANELRYARFLQRLASPAPEAASIYSDPRFQQYMQQIIQEAVSRYGNISFG